MENNDEVTENQEANQLKHKLLFSQGTLDEIQQSIADLKNDNQ